jgi:transcriptional regulator NrdR family protein
MEHIVHSNIMDHFDKNKILTNVQHGFRKKRSCESQLIVTIHEIASKLEKGSQVDIILLDFAKAFDKVPHQRLLHK